MIPGLDDPQALGRTGQREEPAGVRGRGKLVVDGMDARERNRRHRGDDVRRVEDRLVGCLLREVDDRVPEPPAQFVLVRQAERHHAREERMEVGIRGGQHRQPGAEGHADQQRGTVPAPPRRVEEHAVVRAHVRRRERVRSRREAGEVRLAVHAHHEVPPRREPLRHLGCEMDPATVAARHDDGRTGLLPVEAQNLRLAPNRHLLELLGRAVTRRDRRHEEDCRQRGGDRAGRRCARAAHLAAPLPAPHREPGNATRPSFRHGLNSIRRYPPATRAEMSASTGARVSRPG